MSPLPDNVRDELAKALDPRRIAQLTDGPAKGARYLAGADVILRANQIFGFGGWSFRIITPPFVLSPGEADGKNEVWACVGEISVAGASYADMGTCVRSGRGPNAVEMASKGAVTDAMKRAFTCLGDQFGLVLRDKTVSGADIERWYEEENRKEQGHGEQGARNTQAAGSIPASTFRADPIPRLSELLKARGDTFKAACPEVITMDATLEQAPFLAVVRKWFADNNETPEGFIVRLDRVRAERDKARKDVAQHFADDYERCLARMNKHNIGPQVVTTYMRKQFNAASVNGWCLENERTGEDLADLAFEAKRQSPAPVGAR